MERLANITGILIGSFVFSFLILRKMQMPIKNAKDFIAMIVLLIFVLFGAVSIVKLIIELFGYPL